MTGVIGRDPFPACEYADRPPAEILRQFSAEQRRSLFCELRKEFPIHDYEASVGASAETILGAIHRAPELTRRMLRGVIAESAFVEFALPGIVRYGWRDITPIGNFAYDFLLSNGREQISLQLKLQLKLQRSERGKPLIEPGAKYGLPDDVFIVETQKTRSGKRSGRKTRPYAYGEFDLICVALQPSSGDWAHFRYGLAHNLLPAPRCAGASCRHAARTAGDQRALDG